MGYTLYSEYDCIQVILGARVAEHRDSKRCRERRVWAYGGRLINTETYGFSHHAKLVERAALV